VELRQIKELMATMGRTGTKRLVLKKDDFELTLEREERAAAPAESALESLEEFATRAELDHRTNVALSRARELTAPLTAGPLHGQHDGDKAKEVEGSYVTSPMVGTYYASPTPEGAAFVKVGDSVDSNTVLCIVEAMKVMNEVKAGIKGTIAEVLVENGHPVEFGTKLFRIS
jgi:acetyl-CoA carboxylase biotin carboxyl carrier protein